MSIEKSDLDTAMVNHSPSIAVTRANDVCVNIARVFTGDPQAIQIAVAVLLSEGHLLIEDVPGVGKTTLARALAQSMSGTVGRIQFTPDLLPSDLTGVSVYRQEFGTFEFQRGPIFANIVIGDEINRGSPKTQSALLECMQERRVTVDGITHPLPHPFMVVATQNPIEMEGTFPLPEAQRDRFSAQISLGYPTRDAEYDLLDTGEDNDAISSLPCVVTPDDVAQLSQLARSIYASDSLKRYVLDIIEATRTHPDVRLGASPRASIQLMSLARSTALMQGRDYVIPDDIQLLAGPVLAHRLIGNRPWVSGHTTRDIVDDIISHIPVPTSIR